MRHAVDPTDPFGGMADFVIDAEAAAQFDARQDARALQLKASRYEVALRQMQIALRAMPRKPTKADLEHARGVALDVVDEVLMEVG